MCLDSLVDPVITRCAHVFCQQCITDVISSENVAPNCPLCRAPVNENELTKVPVNKKKETTGPEKPPGEPVGEFKKSSKVCVAWIVVILTLVSFFSLSIAYCPGREKKLARLARTGERRVVRPIVILLYLEV